MNLTYRYQEEYCWWRNKVDKTTNFKYCCCPFTRCDINTFISPTKIWRAKTTAKQEATAWLIIHHVGLLDSHSLGIDRLSHEMLKFKQNVKRVHTVHTVHRVDREEAILPVVSCTGNLSDKDPINCIISMFTASPEKVHTRNCASINQGGLGGVQFIQLKMHRLSNAFLFLQRHLQTCKHMKMFLRHCAVFSYKRCFAPDPVATKPDNTRLAAWQSIDRGRTNGAGNQRGRV